ncbi:MAG: glycosyltransferase family 2 protein [Flavobacteriales bacterium]
MTLVSIIVPIYNVEQYLDRCIHSLRNQTYQSIELILVNDGSPDDSQSIIDTHAALDSRIQTIKKENGGLSSARNAGLPFAKGEYITFIDSDDWVESDFIEKLVDTISKTNADIAICDVVAEYDTGEVKTHLLQAETMADVVELTESPDVFLNVDCFACNKLVKRHLFFDYDIRFPEGLLYEDIGTFPSLVFRSKRIAFVRESLYHYIVRKGAITQTFNLKGLDYLKVTERIIEDEKSLETRRFEPFMDSFKIKHNFYSLAINCGYIPKKADRNLAIQTLKTYYKHQGWTWKQIKTAKSSQGEFRALRSPAQRVYYWMFWHYTPVLKLLFNLFHSLKK